MKYVQISAEWYFSFFGQSMVYFLNRLQTKHNLDTKNNA